MSYFTQKYFYILLITILEKYHEKKVVKKRYGCTKGHTRRRIEKKIIEK